MNFPQVFDTWDSGSHGWVASLSRSLVLGSSSPRIGLLVAFWATFQAKGAATKLGPGLLRRGAVLRQNPRASRSGLRARSVSIAPSVHLFCGFSLPPTRRRREVRVALGFASSSVGVEERGICGLVLVRVGQWRGEYVYSSPTWPVLSTALPSAPTSLSTWGLLEAATS